MRSLFSFLIVFFVGYTASADIRLFELHRQKVLDQQFKLDHQNFLKGLGQPGTAELTFQQKLDHFDKKNTKTFSQRYFVNSDYAENSSSPVLLYICGESECTPRYSFLEQAKVLQAHVVFVEHRYYGKSMPTMYLSTENLKYLSTAQALEDLKTIELYLQNEKHMNGKWISVGGSYSGTLSAYYRLKYPELVVGALASSGPVMAKENFEEYDLHVSKVVGPECGAKMKEAVKKVEALLDNPEELLKIKKQFRGEELTDNVDFLYLIADMGALAVQYGYKDRFCELVNSEDPLKGYATFTREIFMLWGMNALDMSAAGALDPQVKDASSNMRQWFYQSCTEYGYWQNAYHDEKISVRSALINSEYHKGICKRLFGLDISGNENYINETFYKPLLNSDQASNILFTNGSQDPWLNLSIAPENKNDVNSKITSFTMEGASHCSDLGHSTLPDVAKGRQMFISFSQAWLGL